MPVENASVMTVDFSFGEKHANLPCLTQTLTTVGLNFRLQETKQMISVTKDQKLLRDGRKTRNKL